MKKYRQKPVIVEAMQVISESFWYGDRIEGFFYNLQNLTITLWTPNGNVTARIGDWIIKYPNGEYTRCFDKSFLMLHEEI